MPHAFTLPGPRAQRVLVLQVAQPAGHGAADPPRASSTPQVRRRFDASDRTYGSPRIHTDLLEAGWTVSENTVAESMRRQGLQGRKPKRRKGLTKQDKTAPKFPDLLKPRLHRRCAEPQVVRGHHRDPDRRRQVVSGHGARSVLPPAARLPDQRATRTPNCARDAIKIAVAVRGGRENDRGRDLPHRPRLDLHGKRFHQAVQGQTRYPPVDRGHPCFRVACLRDR